MPSVGYSGHGDVVRTEIHFVIKGVSRRKMNPCENYLSRLLTSWAADVATFSNSAGPHLAELPIFLAGVELLLPRRELRGKHKSRR